MPAITQYVIFQEKPSQFVLLTYSAKIGSSLEKKVNLDTLAVLLLCWLKLNNSSQKYNKLQRDIAQRLYHILLSLEVYFLCYNAIHIGAKLFGLFRVIVFQRTDWNNKKFSMSEAMYKQNVILLKLRVFKDRKIKT